MLKILQWMLPEVVSFLSSLLFYFLHENTNRTQATAINLKEVVIVSSDKESEQKSRHVQWKFETAGIYASTMFLCMAGVMQPSILNSTYFVSFLITATWLACNKRVNQKFVLFLRFVSLVLCSHVTMIILYQTPSIQSLIPSGGLAFRVSGLSKIFSAENSTTGAVINGKLNSNEYINPFLLVSTHFILTTTARAINVRILFLFNVIFVTFSLFHRFQLSKKKLEIRKKELSQRF